MKKHRVKKVMTEQELVIDIKCDECGKNIGTNKFYEVNTHHRLWGRDSVESYEELDFCNEECLINNLKKYLKKCTNTTISYDIERIKYDLSIKKDE